MSGKSLLTLEHCEVTPHVPENNKHIVVSPVSSHALKVTRVKCNAIGIHSNRHISVVLFARGIRGFSVVAYYLRVVKVKLEQRKG